MMTAAVRKKYKIKDSFHLYQISFFMKENGRSLVKGEMCVCTVYSKISLESKNNNFIIQSSYTCWRCSFYLIYYSDDYFYDKLLPDEIILYVIKELINIEGQTHNLPTIFASPLQWDVFSYIFLKTQIIPHDADFQEEIFYKIKVIVPTLCRSKISQLK